MRHLVVIWGNKTGRHIAYNGTDYINAKQEMNHLRNVLTTLLPDERIVEISTEIDGEPVEWTDITRPWCDHCGHIVAAASRWLATSTFLCEQHRQEMMDLI